LSKRDKLSPRESNSSSYGFKYGLDAGVGYNRNHANESIIAAISSWVLHPGMAVVERRDGWRVGPLLKIFFFFFPRVTSCNCGQFEWAKGLVLEVGDDGAGWS
jgi:hypothetical protein